MNGIFAGRFINLPLQEGEYTDTVLSCSRLGFNTANIPAGIPEIPQRDKLTAD
jgi:hypothetical protein